MAAKYNALIQTHLTKEQLERLTKIAESEGLTVASWLRRMIIKEINLAERGIDGWIVEDDDEGRNPKLSD